METWALLLAAAIHAGTPLVLAGIGVLLVERSGVVNLGVEGMMLVAAVLAFAATWHSGWYSAGFLAGALAGAALACVFALFALGLATNQYATGLAIALLGSGLSAFIGLPYSGLSLPARGADGIPLLRELPIAGPLLFGHHTLVYFSLLLVGAVAWMLFRTRAGLVLRAVGESPESAHALGHPVQRVRLAALLAGGACVGMAGAYLSTVYTPLWAEDMTAGRGWIALALVVFATWRPARVLAGAWLFGGVTMLQLHLQGLGVNVPSQLMSMAPYLATIIVLAVIARRPGFVRVNMPASLGRTFSPNR
jgi:general nucleoside transport system permease protein